MHRYDKNHSLILHSHSTFPTHLYYIIEVVLAVKVGSLSVGVMYNFSPPPHSFILKITLYNHHTTHRQCILQCLFLFSFSHNVILISAHLTPTKEQTSFLACVHTVMHTHSQRHTSSGHCCASLIYYDQMWTHQRYKYYVYATAGYLCWTSCGRLRCTLGT